MYSKVLKFTLPFLLLLQSMVFMGYCAEPSAGITSASGVFVTKWVPVSPGGNIVLQHPDPAGLEFSNPTYVCKAKVNGDREKPGKLWITDGYYFCSIAESGREIQSQTFELLETTPGATSWIPYTGGVPTNSIVGGAHGFGAAAYVCRATIGGSVLIGNLNAFSASCGVSGGGTEYTVSEASNIEVLVVNAYGLAL